MVEPLRIQKGPATSSPQKNGDLRALAELSPITARRNSPSAQTVQQLLDASTFESSPFSSKFSIALMQKESPHLYWQSRDTPSPTRGLETQDLVDESAIASKRPSVENLKRASRVTKSNIFALEQKQGYDPMSPPSVERPLASGRPLAATMPLGLQARNSILDHSKLFDRRRVQAGDEGTRPHSPSRLNFGVSPKANQSPLFTIQQSPTKSAMSQNPRFSLYDPETSIWSDADEHEERKLPPGKGLHRHAKSVTFNKSPPQVNEYEQITPDPSVSANSRESSYDDESDSCEYDQIHRGRDDSQDSFDECLQDTDKTPVELPETWSRGVQIAAHASLVAHLEDPFGHDGASDKVNDPDPVQDTRGSPARTDSLNSNGSRRPLPPLPPPSFPRERADSQDSLEAVAERAATAHRSFPPTPSAAGISKDELRVIGSSAMSLEERLSLMSVQDTAPGDAHRKTQDDTRERRMRRKSGLHNSISEGEIRIFEDAPDEDAEDQAAGIAELQPVPRISRDSILRKVKSQRLDEYRSPEPQNVEEEVLPQLNPDEPIQSYEDSPSFLEGDDQIEIKAEDDVVDVDMYALPEHKSFSQALMSVSKSAAVAEHEDDTDSQYSTDTTNAPKGFALEYDDSLPTPRAEAAGAREEARGDTFHRMSLPGFSNMLDNDFGLSLSSYMTPSPEDSMTKQAKQVDIFNNAPVQELSHRPLTPDLARVPGYSDEELREPSTPDSVIRRSVSIESSETLQEEVPEPVATIKASGSRMKTRPSLTPQDVRAMAETRRQVSGGHPAPPSFPERHANRPSMIAEADSFLDDPRAEEMCNEKSEQLLTDKHDAGLPRLDISVHEEDPGDLSFGIDKEFDRLMEAQKKGYLMRQNTKMVVATSATNTTTTADDATLPNKPVLDRPSARETRSANSSPIKKSKHEASGAWQTHEWNGKTRRKSIRQSGGLPSEFAMSGGAPPLPGLPSAVSELEALGEVDEADDAHPDGAERGRLFVRVIGLKDLNLPLPRNERPSFALTLDNGLHCVTTSWLDLAKTAPIGQEFELVVLNELEFQLTLQVKLEQPKPAPRPDSPSKQTSPLKKGGFGRFFGSPKKRKEQEIKQEQDRLARERLQHARSQPSAWDLLHKSVAKDGSFARSYVSFAEYEDQAYGRPLTVDVPCFNEWALEDARTITTTRGSRTGAGIGSPQLKAPYKVGKLELQLLYVPKPMAFNDEDMPKSMNACVREMQEAEKTSNQIHEGYLSQQGGDCPYWRRRFFRLSGGKLTAYHEATRQPRATINLAKAVKLIDDKTNLKQQTMAKTGGRRKSAFGSEEDGYMFLEEGFRVRFANGETIDFYADNVALKDGWMHALADVVGRDNRPTKGWTDAVLKREKVVKQKADREHDRRKTSAEAKAKATTASSFGGVPVPGQKTSSRGDSGKRPSSSHANNESQPGQLKQGEVMGPPAPPAKDRRTMDPAERRAKARSTYY